MKGVVAVSDQPAERTSKSAPAAKQTPASRATVGMQVQGARLPVLVGIIAPLVFGLMWLWIVPRVPALADNAAWRFALLPHFDVWHQLHQPQWYLHLNLVQYVGVALWLSGLAILVWPNVYFVKKGETLDPDHETHQLIKVGPYRYLMHPMFNGVPKMIIAWALMLGAFPVLVWWLIFDRYIVDAILYYENIRLTQQFGAEYVQMRDSLPSKKLFRWFLRDPIDNPKRDRKLAKKAAQAARKARRK